MIVTWQTKTVDEIRSPDIRSIAMGPFGSNIRKENYRPVGVPVIRGINLNAERFIDDGFVFLSEEKADELRGSNAFPEDIIFTAQGSIGQVGIIPKNSQYARYVLSQNLMKVTCNKNRVDPLYVFYYFRSAQGQHEIISRANPTGVPCISQPLTSLRSFKVRLPPLPKQKTIASILGALDNKIELNRKMNVTLEAMARAIFKSWFVDFDPIPGLGPHKERQDSPLGKIPKGWRVGTVDEEFNLTMGQSPPGVSYNETGEGLPFYQGRADFGFRFPTRRVYCTAPTRFAETGDTLVSVRAPVGDINMAAERCCIGRGVAAVSHKSGSRSYTYYFMHASKEVFDRFEAEGTVFGSISKKDFHNIRCIMPPVPIITAFERLAASFDDKIANNDQETSTLAALRDTLLPQLISGELRVNNVDKVIAGVSI